MKNINLVLLASVLSLIISCGDDNLNLIGSSTDATLSRAETLPSDTDSLQDPNTNKVPGNDQGAEYGYDSEQDIPDNLEEEDLSGLKDELSQYLIHLKRVRSNTPSGGASVLQDVVSYYFSGSACFPYTNYYSSDPDTYAHEATHGLNACLRNNYNTTGEVVNGFYLLEGRAIVIREPHIRKSQVANYIPTSLRNLDLTKRFNTYVTGQTSFESNPLYIFDEWNAYIHGALESIDQFKTKNYQTSAALLGAGATEFMVYATALGLAASELDPDYFKRETKFSPLYKHLVEKTMRVLQEGADYPRVVDPTMLVYFNKFKTDSSAEKLRNFIRTYMGTGWAKKVLGI